MEKIEKFISGKFVLYIAFILNLFHDLKIRGRNGLIAYLKMVEFVHIIYIIMRFYIH